jgi:hypothetical protein
LDSTVKLLLYWICKDEIILVSNSRFFET